jgi:MFS family permease
VLTAAVWGGAVALAGLAPSTWMVLVCFTVAGAADMVSGIFRSTIWHQTIPDSMRGRLAGIEMLSYSLGPLGGQARAGLVADRWGVRASITSGGVLCVLGVLVTSAWLLADLGALHEAGAVPAGGYDLVLAAGNVIPLLAEGALEPTVAELAGALSPTGLLVCGFGLDAAHLPPGCPVTPLSAYDRACDAAGLGLVRRLAAWDGAPYDGGGYAVSVHVLAGIVHSAQP